MMATQFGLLTFVQDTGERTADGHVLSLWLCECGNTAKVRKTRVTNGYTKSCGCLMSKGPAAANTKHGGRSTPEYRSWRAMRSRCHNPTDKDFPRYGGAGIGVCASWRESFAAFRDHIGPRPSGTTLDRIDGRLGYIPGNVRWATATEQNRNKANFVMVATPEGEKPLVDYAAELGITRGAAHQRLKRGTLEGVI